jgi:hypothetical protein
MNEMRKLRWRDCDKHHAREARVVGGPHNGPLVPVKEKRRRLRHPDVMDFEPCTFDPEA